MGPGQSGGVLDIQPTAVAAIKLPTPKKIGDARSLLSEVYKRNALELAGLVLDFVQENHLFSQRSGTVRGLHFEAPVASSATTSSIGQGLAQLLSGTAKRNSGATVFAHEVADPQQHCVIAFDGRGRATFIEEKSSQPRSNWAGSRLYFHDNDVIRYAQEVKPSARGDLEITGVNRRYLAGGQAARRAEGTRHAWLDMGTIDSLLEAFEFVSVFERRQGLKIGCPEEIALRFGYVTIEAIEPWLAELGNSGYAGYVRNVATSV